LLRAIALQIKGQQLRAATDSAKLVAVVRAIAIVVAAPKFAVELL
jgi:hypothetical protein